MVNLSKKIPNDVGSVFFEPGRRILGYRIVADTSEDFYGDLVRAVSSVGGSIRSLRLESDGNLVVAVVLVEVDRGRRAGLELLRRLRRSRSLRLIEPLESPREDMVVDSEAFPPTFMGRRALILERSAYEAFVRRLREKYGTGYSAMLYHIGLNMGYSVCEEHRDFARGGARELLRMSAVFFAAMGFGIVRVVSVSRESAVVRVYDNFECELFRGAGAPSSHFTRGFLAGWLAAVWGTEASRVTCVEERCLARGDSFCEFRAVKGRNRT